MPRPRKRGFDVVVIGGGIAGLATAHALLREGTCTVAVLEREPGLGWGATGSSAAIFRHLHEDHAGVELAVRSADLLTDLERRASRSLLHRTGALYLGARAALAAAHCSLGTAGLPCAWIDAAELRARVPALAWGAAALSAPADGVLDAGALVQALAAELRAAGAQILPNTAVLRAVRKTCFTLDTSVGSFEAGAVVIAAGAWSSDVGNAFGARVPLTPLRRHLALLEVDEPVSRAWPVVWLLNSNDEVYFRPESGAVLASPCDEAPWRPPDSTVVAIDREIAGQLHARLQKLSPGLAQGRLKTLWSGLRTFSPDRDFVVGRDAVVPGLHWCVGLGGRGLSCGLALGELAAASVLGREHRHLPRYAPARVAAAKLRSGPPESASPASNSIQHGG